MKHIDDFEYKSIDNLVDSLRIIVLLGSLLAIIIVLILHKQKNDHKKQKTYFKEIIDSTHEIIIVTNFDYPIDVNKAFFEFFDEFNTLKEFEKEYGCLCSLFEKEDGYLQKEMGEYSWVEYIFNHPNIEHKAKIIYKQKEYIFLIHIKELNTSKDKTYTLVLTDITKMKKQQDKLEYLSQTDTLTNIGNREYFNQNISRELKMSQRYDNKFSLIMFDIDHFKSVNDTYGHDVGDIVLTQLAAEVKKLLRTTDLFCRYGGEEFMVILPNDSMSEAMKSAQRMRANIEKLKIDPVEKVTISIGVVEFQEDDSVETMIKRVDNAMYQSKNSGRNRITSA